MQGMTESSRRPTFQAVLPLALTGTKEGGDLQRAVLQGRSFGHFFRRDQLLRINVVGRAGELAQIEDALKPLEQPWLQYAVVDEATVHPGLSASPVSGWIKQQIIKLAAPEWLGAGFWMTLDADVFCAKPVEIDDLLPGGRALLWVDELKGIPGFTRWAWASRELLGMVAPPQMLVMGVTPLIYAAPIMRAMYQMIESAHRRPWKDVLLDQSVLAAFRERYGASWAEHHLYYAAGERSGLLRTCHAFSGIDAPQRLHGHGVWRNEDWPNWDPAPAFDTGRPGYFSVCNSYTGMPASVVAAKIEPYLNKEPPPKQPPSPAWLFDHAAETAAQGTDLRVRILSRRPLVIMGPFDQGRSHLCHVLSRHVLEPFQRQPAIVLVTLPTSLEHVEGCRLLAATIARRQREAPLHRIVVLGNTEIEVEMMRQLGVASALVSHNAMLDERPFLADSAAAPEFDAVYNAGFHPAKRHALAAQIPSLALIYSPWHDLPQYAAYTAEAKLALPQAAYLNLDGNGEYRMIPHEELGAQLQRARVGLCLSPVEGAMRASLEYLFAGLPVVSTFSIGGRDQFFDGDLCAVVPPEPALIAAAVRELAARELPRAQVRMRTMHKLAPHRERLMQLVMQSLASIGHSGTADIVWPWLHIERVPKVETFHRWVREEPPASR